MDPALLFIIIFILAPIIERLLKAGRQRPPGEDTPQERRPPRRMPEQRRPLPWEEEPRPRGPMGTEEEEEGVSAAEMLPDDLWEILTGEKRQRPAPEPPRTQPPVETPAPYREREVEARREPADLPPPVPRTSRAEPPAPPQPAGARRTRERVDLRERRLPPVEIRRQPTPEERRPTVRMRRRPGQFPPQERIPAERRRHPVPTGDEITAEAIADAPEIVSLEDLTIDADERHTRFHDRLARLEGPAVVQRRAMHELAVRFRDRGEIRRAFVMSEVLGPPRAMNPRRHDDPGLPPS